LAYVILVHDPVTKIHSGRLVAYNRHTLGLIDAGIPLEIAARRSSQIVEMALNAGLFTSSRPMIVERRLEYLTIPVMKDVIRFRRPIRLLFLDDIVQLSGLAVVVKQW
jgi:hypothetical protein